MENTLGIIVNRQSSQLMPLTDHRNPITLPFFARYRLVDFTLSNMVNSRIGKIGIVASDKYRSLLDHVGTGQEWGLSRKSNSLAILQGTRSLNESDTPQINLKDFEKNKMVFERSRYDNVLIAASDVVCHIDYKRILDKHREMDGDMTFVCQDIEPDDREDGGIFVSVDEKNNVTRVQINSKVGCNKKVASKIVVKRDVMLNLIKVAGELGQYEMITLVKNNIDFFNVKAYQYDGYMRKIQTINDYLNTNLELLDLDISKKLFDRDDIIYTKIKDNHPTLYKNTSDVKGSAVASGSTIAGKVRNSVLFRNVEQSENSIISNSILMEGCKIGKGAQLDYVISDRNVVIGDGIVIKGTPTNPVVLQKEMVI